MAKLDEDRADVISFLNRTLSEKSDEILELNERLEGLQQVFRTKLEFSSQILAACY